MAADLTALLPYKQYADARTQRKLKRVERPPDEDEEQNAKYDFNIRACSLPILKIILKTTEWLRVWKNCGLHCNTESSTTC